MEYQKKKKQILSSVEYTNLLSLALVENKLQKNFKSIVEALLLSQAEGNQIKQDLLSFTKSTNKQFGLIHDKMSQLEKRLQQGKKKQHSKPSIHKDSDTEEMNFHSENTTPIINVNLVQTPKNSQQDIPSKKSVNKEINQKNQYKQLNEKLNKLLSEQVDPYEIDKKLSTMKDSINILKAEVKALSDREAKSARRVSLGSLQKIQKISGTQKSTQNIQTINAFNGIQAQLQKQINNLHIEVNTLKLWENEKRRKNSKSHIQLDDLIKNQKKLEQRVQNANDTFETQIKEIKVQLLNLQTKTQEQQNITKKSKKIIQIKQNVSPNNNNQINDKISKLQAMIQGLVTQAQFKRFKSQIKDKITCLQNQDQNIRKQFKQQVQMLTQILDSKQQQISNIEKDIQEIQNRFNDMSQNCERKNNIAISRSDQLKKNLQNLRQDLEFYKSINQMNGIQKGVTHQQGNNINTSGFNNSGNKNNNQQVSNESTQELKKYLNRKLHDQRTYLLGLIRDLEKKSSGGKTPLEQDLISIWDKISQVNLFLNKKANQDDIKKSLGYFEKKLTKIYQRITCSDQNKEDARIAKTNWFCLSCDKNLQSYKGKVGQHVVWDSMPIKEGYTKYYTKQEKKSLPTLKR